MSKKTMAMTFDQLVALCENHGWQLETDLQGQYIFYTNEYEEGHDND